MHLQEGSVDTEGLLLVSLLRLLGVWNKTKQENNGRPTVKEKERLECGGGVDEGKNGVVRAAAKFQIEDAPERS